MNRYIPITENMSIVEQEIRSTKIIKKKLSVNHIWIYDRSGSMTGLLPELTSQLIFLSKKIPVGDSVSLGWFSSEGDYNWIIKGFRVTATSDYAMLEKAIKNNSSPRGCTCFSEILGDVDTVIRDLSVFSDVFSLHFFTDGYPVVIDYKKEIKHIYEALSKIKGKILASMFFSYGYYYNKELMSQMAEKLGAVLISSSYIPEYADTITKLIKLTDNSESKEEVDPLVSNPLAVFTVTDQGVVTYSLDDGGKVLVAPQKGKTSYVYYVSTDKPDKKSWTKVDIVDINFGDASDRLSKALYAGALILTQQTKTDIALEIIGKCGDKHVVDGLTNAFTIEEYTAIEDTVNKAIQDVSLRFSEGRDSSYLPPVDAFCVFDLLNMLMEDDKAAFYPYHPKFSYEKIGVASKEKDGYAKFKADTMSQSPFENMTWHESRLNLSVLTKIQGTIDLQTIDEKGPQAYGFSNPYPTFVFRNYTFVKDGRVHTKKFFVASSEKTYIELKNRGLVFEDAFKKDGTYGVDMSKLPAMNRAMASGKTSATELCKMALAEQKLKGKIKALKWLKDDLFGEEAVDKPLTFTDAQAAFLRANGIAIERGGLYSPPKALEEAKDYYMAKSFEIKIAGLASLPTVKKVMEKVASKKGRTPVEGLVEEGINLYAAVKESKKGKDLLKWFEDTIKAFQKELKDIRTTLQKVKMSVVLGKAWFDEFTSRDQNTLEVNGNKFVFELGEEKVEI
jgi:hypothetical protein